MFNVYWQGMSLRAVAAEWGTDELAVIREHKSILEHLLDLANGKPIEKKLKVRRALRPVAMKMRDEDNEAPFQRFSPQALALILFLALDSLGTII